MRTIKKSRRIRLRKLIKILYLSGKNTNIQRNNHKFYCENSEPQTINGRGNFLHLRIHFECTFLLNFGLSWLWVFWCLFVLRCIFRFPDHHRFPILKHWSLFRSWHVWICYNTQVNRRIGNVRKDCCLWCVERWKLKFFSGCGSSLEQTHPNHQTLAVFNKTIYKKLSGWHKLLESQMMGVFNGGWIPCTRTVQSSGWTTPFSSLNKLGNFIFKIAPSVYSRPEISNNQMKIMSRLGLNEFWEVLNTKKRNHIVCDLVHHMQELVLAK